MIDWSPGIDGSVLMVRQYVPETTTGTYMGQTASGLGVDLVDTVSLKTSRRETASDTAREYITDGNGSVRIVGRRQVTEEGYTNGALRYYYRAKDSRVWQPLSVVGDGNDGFDPYGVDPAKNVAYGLKRLSGRLAAYSVALDGTGKEELIFSRPDVDISGFVRIGRKGRIVGVSYETDRPQVAYFDQDLVRLQRSLAKAIPSLPLIRFIDASEDESKLLLWAGSDVDPGRYFLLDRKTHKMATLFDDRPALQSLKLATMKAITFKAADGTPIPAYLTLPAGGSSQHLPAIVMPHGGPASRDHWGFDWLPQYFASQGFAVLQPNFRGSTGYGDAFFLQNGFKSWKVAIGDVSDAGRWLVSEGIADPKKLAVVGWSYGGYAALQSAVVVPDLFKAVIAIAPITDFNQFKEEHKNWSDYLAVSEQVGIGAHLIEGSPARRVSEFKAPVLLFHGKLDRNVRSNQSVTMNNRLQAAGKSSELILYPDLDHYLEDSDVRAALLRKSSAFLAAAFGPAAQ